MKKLAVPFVVATVIIFGCTRKAAPTIPERPVEPVSGNKVDTADFSSSNPLVAGKAIYKIKCTTCHKEKNVTDWTQEEWKPILNSMVKKAKLNELQISQVTQYVNANAKQ
ncbi:c-type cytochrome [Niabella beijingensis]|uniref:c-type cytochrome n=1 Tax=Niabella beijingensis TaxID=2872700 RepID=UPI001CBBE4E6|nr:cytochrome c [Niabella beijingensis]MBZ4188746.1 cytochrome c [Niabella beijingensis]